MNTSITQQLHLISNHSQWKLMSWETRGMALELMALPGTENFLGTLPSEDDLWRNALNIPSQRSIQSALKKSVNGRGLREQNELDIAWNDVWKPELLRWFQVITVEFAEQNPLYKNCVGRYWHPLLDIHNTQHTSDEKKTGKTSAKTRSKSHEEIAQKVSTTRVNKGRKVQTLGDPAWDYPTIRYSPNTFKSCWEEPLTHEARANLWDSALRVLAPGGDTVSARQFIGKLIKEFGEKNTAAAVAQLVVRAVPPADPKSFLRKQLKNLTEGSEKEKQANRMHVHVPL